MREEPRGLEGSQKMHKTASDGQIARSGCFPLLRCGCQQGAGTGRSPLTAPAAPWAGVSVAGLS